MNPRDGGIAFLAAAAVFLMLSSPATALAAPTMEEKDLDGDGRPETQVFSEGNRIVKTIADKNHDGRPDAWVSYRNGRPDKGERDRDHDGKLDTWEEYDAQGDLKTIRQDRSRGDGRVDYWAHLERGRIFKREWDRNFDGKPDLRTFEDRHRFLKKQYDNDFNGSFEKTVRAPARGDSGLTPTTAQS